MEGVFLPAAVFFYSSSGGIAPPSCNDLREERSSAPSSWSVSAGRCQNVLGRAGRPQLIDRLLWGLFPAALGVGGVLANRRGIDWVLCGRWSEQFLFFLSDRLMEYIRGESTQQLTAALQPRFSVICSRQTRARPRYEVVEDHTRSFFPLLFLLFLWRFGLCLWMSANRPHPDF